MTTRRTCKHTRITTSDVYPMSGECSMESCHAAFGYVVDRCLACGAERTICQGMGAASHQAHVRAGYARWQAVDEEED